MNDRKSLTKGYLLISVVNTEVDCVATMKVRLHKPVRLDVENKYGKNVREVQSYILSCETQEEWVILISSVLTAFSYCLLSALGFIDVCSL